MGKQVQFYMTHEDEKNFLASISDLSPVRLVFKSFVHPSPMELGSFAPVGGHEDDTDLCLINATLGTVPKVNSYPQHSYRFVDLAESEVVEFLRCKPAKGHYRPSHTWLSNGRLWFAEQTMDGRKSMPSLSGRTRSSSGFARTTKGTPKAIMLRQMRSNFSRPQAPAWPIGRA